MQCQYFNQCGSCSLPKPYAIQLEHKRQREQERFFPLYEGTIEVFESQTEHFRKRAEFRVYHDQGKLSYAMHDRNIKLLCIESCSIVDKSIHTLMPKLLVYIEQDDTLKEKLFYLEFIASTQGELLVSMIYHKKLFSQWEAKAKRLEEMFGIHIIGRSKKQRIIVSQSYIHQRLTLENRDYTMMYHENGFIQPNTRMNISMIEWVLKSIQSGGDLCELYCGAGNFTLPLSKKFDRVLATEISKTSIAWAQHNAQNNKVTNIDFVRMSSSEFVDALKGVRAFRRLKTIQLDTYRFTTVFVDPPRAGLDDITRELIQTFDQIIYISCNPDTLYRDLVSITLTHRISNFALFDQFAYTHHIELGIVLQKSV